MNYVLRLIFSFFSVLILLTGCVKSVVLPIEKSEVELSSQQCQIDNIDAPKWLCGLKDKNIFKNSNNDYFALGVSPENNSQNALNSAKDKITPEMNKVIKLHLESLFLPLKRNVEMKDIEQICTNLLGKKEALGSWAHPKNNHLYSVLKISADDITNTTRDYLNKSIRLNIEECFESGSVSVSSQCKSIIKKDDFFTQKENQYILIEVHTDKTGESKYNDRISKQRAAAIAEVLASYYPKRTIYFAGRGEKSPVIDDETPEANSINRRSVFSYVFPKEISNYEGIVKYSKQEDVVKKNPIQHVEKKVSEKETPKDTGISTTVQKSTIITPDREVIVPVVKQEKSIDPSAIDFGGSIAQHTNPGFERFVGKWDDSDKTLQKRCFDTLPIKQKRESSKGMSLTEYLPGLHGVPWIANMNHNLVALDHLTVLSSGGLTENNPNLLIYKDYSQGSKNTATKKLHTIINTFKGEKGLLYRLYVDSKDSVQCADIIFTKEGKNYEVKKGEFYYVKDKVTYIADIKAHRVK